MAFARWSIVVAILVISRSAGSDCSAPGVSQGFEQCQQYPACECSSQVIACPGGGWYTQYSVDLTRCGGGGAGGGGSAGSGAGSGSDAKPRTPCEVMNKWLDEEHKFLAAYQDDRLLNTAIKRGWRPSEYNKMLWRATHPGAQLPKDKNLSPGEVPSVMSTNRKCEIENYASGCAWLLDQGLPQAACEIALAHEQVHVAQCLAKGSKPFPTDLRTYRDREVEAHQHTVADIEQWIQSNCP